VGNGAADQRQNDVYGEILDCAYQWAVHHGKVDEALWSKLLARRIAGRASGSRGSLPLYSFWLVDNLAGQGRLEDALNLYHSLCGRAGPLGLLPEQIDPKSGEFLGNYPQAFSHIGVIASGFRWGRLLAQKGERDGNSR
jgi:hypothetical protein